MNTEWITNAHEWMVETRHYWIEVLRMVLGVLMLNNGLYFIRNTQEIHAMIEEALPIAPFIVAHYVVVAFLAGGVLLIIGLVTRVAALLHIPILFGAVVCVHGLDVFMGGAEQAEYALLVLFLMIAFFFYGGGRWSMDHQVLRKAEEE